MYETEGETQKTQEYGRFLKWQHTQNTEAEFTHINICIPKNNCSHILKQVLLKGNTKKTQQLQLLKNSKTMLPGKPSSRCALHHVFPSSSSLYLALSPFLWKHARKTTQWRKVKCKVSGAGRGVRRSAACCLARIPSLSGLQDEQRTKQPEMAASEQTCLRPLHTHLISFTQGHQDDDRKWNGQQKNKQKKKNPPTL